MMGTLYQYFHLLEEVKDMKKRYLRNISTLTPDENEKLKDFRVCIIGCGGLGGYIVEMLAKM